MDYRILVLMAELWFNVNSGLFGRAPKLNLCFFSLPLFPNSNGLEKRDRKMKHLLVCHRITLAFDSILVYVNLRIYPKRGGVPSTALWPTSSFLGAFPVNLYLHWRTNKIAFVPRLNPTMAQIHTSLRGKGSTNDTGISKVDIVIMYIM